MMVMTHLVLIDIDIKYETMEKYNLFEILNDKIDYCLGKFNIKAEYIRFDKSQCGNTHLHLVLDRNIEPETVIKLKFCIGEDHKRLMHSIRRYEATGKILDFFWLNKIKDCKDE